MPAELSTLDRAIVNFDRGMKTLFGGIGAQSERPSPAQNINEPPALEPHEQQRAARLMRVNHCGEICAQALYQGQMLTSQSAETSDLLSHAADEEIDHLAWCEERLKALNSHPTYLGSFFYLGSFSLGALAGMMGDRWSLGFVSETERQVEQHLASHIEKLPSNDLASQAILQQMQCDEIEHGMTAKQAGGRELPAPIKAMMRLSSKVMTNTTYWI